MNRQLYITGRILVALLFLVSGVGKLGASAAIAGVLASKGLPQPQLLVFAAASVEILGAIALIAGFRLREAAAVLIAFSLIATAIFHQFWTFEGMERVNQMNHLLKNLAVVGGLILLIGAARPVGRDATA